MVLTYDIITDRKGRLMKRKRHLLLFFYLKTLIIAGIVVFLGVYHYMNLNAAPITDIDSFSSASYIPSFLNAVNSRDIKGAKGIIENVRKAVNDKAASAGKLEGLSDQESEAVLEPMYLSALKPLVNARVGGEDNMTVLGLAVFNGNKSKTPKIIETLLRDGADPALQDKEGNTPLHQVVNVTSPEAKNKVAYLLLDYQAPINIQNYNNGNTPMHSIVQVPQLDLARYMFKNFGPMMDLNIKNKAGYTVIDLARNNVVVDVLNPYLEKHGQRFGEDDGQARDVFGRTGLMLAIMRNDYEFAKKQIELRNADVNTQANNRYGTLPLQFACMRGKNVLPYIKLLLKHGADPRLTDKAGDTPLHMVFDISDVKDRKKAASLLLQKGAYLLATNNDGNTPLHIAVIKKDTDMVTFFKNKLGTWVKNKKGKTAQELAIAEKLRVLR